MLKLGIRLADDHHVVMREDGLPLQPRSLTHAFQIFLGKQKLQRVRLHDLRHTHAIQLLKNGVHPKIATIWRAAALIILIKSTTHNRWCHRLPSDRPLWHRRAHRWPRREEQHAHQSRLSVLQWANGLICRELAVGWIFGSNIEHYDCGLRAFETRSLQIATYIHGATNAESRCRAV
jgi:hypothetical protein